MFIAVMDVFREFPRFLCFILLWWLFIDFVLLVCYGSLCTVVKSRTGYFTMCL